MKSIKVWMRLLQPTKDKIEFSEGFTLSEALTKTYLFQILVQPVKENPLPENSVLRL